MVKLITPMGMLITLALLVIYAVYAFRTAYIDESWIYGLLGVLSLAACYGTAMLRAWSQYLVYSLTALFIAAWCYSVYAGAAVGYFSFFFPRICSQPRLWHQGSHLWRSRVLRAGRSSAIVARGDLAS